MGKNRVFLQRRQARRLVEHQEGVRTAYVLYETAWADAWPHLDDWFTTETLLLPYGRNRAL
jgi:hypothetical protein